MHETWEGMVRDFLSRHNACASPVHNLPATLLFSPSLAQSRRRVCSLIISALEKFRKKGESKDYSVPIMTSDPFMMATTSFPTCSFRISPTEGCGRETLPRP